MALTNKLTAIADAIREKNGETKQYTLDEMPTAISEISGGSEVDTFEEYLIGGLESYSNSNITTIGDYKFYNDKTIKNIDLPNCESVGRNFAYLSALESISIPKLKTINIGFLNNNLLKEFVNDSLEDIHDYSNSKSDGSGYMFQSLSELTKLQLSNVTYIGTSCFTDVSSLTDIYLPKLIWIAQGCFGGLPVEIIDDNMFPVLKQIGGWRNATTSSSSDTFSGCKNLKKVSITNLIHLKDAFSYCSNLSEVFFPNLITLTGNYSFNGCSEITKFSFPKLTKIDLRYSVMNSLEYLDCGIITNFMVNCENFPKIKTIILRKEDAIVTNYNRTSYDPKTTDYSIYVPRALIDEYKTATNWSRLAGHFVALEDYTDDGTCSGNFIEGGRKIVSSEGSVLTISNVPDITSVAQDGTTLILS